MNGMDALLAHPVVEGTAWVLLHFLWQGALIALLLGVVRLFLPAQDSTLRLRAASGAMGLMFLAPVATAAVLAFRNSLFAGGISSSPGLVSGVTESSPLSRFEFAPASLSSGMYLVEPWLPTLVLFWAAGVILLSIRNLNAFSQVRLLTRHGVSAPPSGWAATLQRLAEELGVTRRVRLLGSQLVSVPTVVGWLNPVILVPVGAFTGLHPRHLEAILAHELAHVRRHDYFLNLLQTCVETVLFFHPAVWWVSGQIRQERENCCDDIAVRCCGDAKVVARALAEMEGLRTFPLGMGMGADGGSLLSRITRLVGQPRSSGPRDRWVPTTLVLATVLGFLFLGMEAHQSTSNAAVIKDDTTKQERTLESDKGSRSLDDGDWRAEYEDGHLSIRVSYNGNDWMTGQSISRWGFTKRQVDAVLASDVIDFEYPREGGTFAFTGKVTSRGRQTKASGSFTFTPDPEYAETLQSLGYSRREVEHNQMELAGHDVSSRYIKDLAGLGYEDLTLTRLVEFKIHGVSTQYVRAMHEAGYRDTPAARLVEFRIHGVSPEFVSGMMNAGYAYLDADRLVEFRIHGVSPEFVSGMMNAGYAQVPPDRLVEMRIHGVSPDFAGDMRDAGLADLTVAKMIEMRIHGVTPGFVDDMHRLFDKKIPADKLVEMRIHGVTSEFVEDMRDRGFDDLTPDEMIEIKIQGLDRYLKRLR